MVKKKRRLTIM